MSDSRWMLQAAKLFAAAVASYGRIEGMKAENQRRMICDNHVPYGEQAFYQEAEGLVALQSDILNFG